MDNNHNPVNEVNIRIRVRYAECDAQQIVFNARYGEYADVGATEYMRALIGKHQNMVDAGFDSQVVSLHIDWFASAVFDDELNLRVFVKRIGNTSFTLQTDCTRVEQDGALTPIASVVTTYVVVDTQLYQKAQIPPLLRDNFTKQFNKLVNQAG